MSVMVASLAVQRNPRPILTRQPDSTYIHLDLSIRLQLRTDGHLPDLHYYQV